MNQNYQAILYDGVVMPLVDSNDSLIDTTLSETLNNLFITSKRGQIIDSSGNFWIIWSTAELELWWNIFESVVGIPFGRKLFNSCCDEEEYQIFNSELLVSGFFKNRKNRNSFINRWQNFGWGKLDIKNTKIESLLPATIASGFAVAAIESISRKRFKSEWRQKTNTEIFIDLKMDERVIPLAKKHVELPWSTRNNGSVGENLKVGIERRPLGWSIDGEPSVMLPVSLFSRLYYSTIGMKSSLKNDEINSWYIEGLEERYRQPLIIAAHSIYKLFMQSGRHVFADSEDSWVKLLEYYCNQWGWGGIDNLVIEPGTEIISLTVQTSELLPFLLGRALGIWECSYGKKPKISIHFSENQTSFKIESFLEYI
jgi:hypothetical protein